MAHSFLYKISLRHHVHLSSVGSQKLKNVNLFLGGGHPSKCALCWMFQQKKIGIFQLFQWCSIGSKKLQINITPSMFVACWDFECMWNTLIWSFLKISEISVTIFAKIDFQNEHLLKIFNFWGIKNVLQFLLEPEILEFWWKHKILKNL